MTSSIRSTGSGAPFELIVDIEPSHGKAPPVASRSDRTDCWRELCRIAIAPMIAKVYSVDKIGANAKKTSVER
jgi:hypothetical protein